MRAGRVTAVLVCLAATVAAPPARAELSFSETPHPMAGVGPGDPFIADTDGANGPEILVASGGSGRLHRLPNQGGGAFGGANSFAGCPGPAYGLGVSGWEPFDGVPDAVVYCYGQFAYLRGDGVGGFGAPVMHTLLYSTEIFTIGELNGAAPRELIYSGQLPQSQRGKPLCTASFTGSAVGGSGCNYEPDQNSFPVAGRTFATGDLGGGPGHEIMTPNGLNPKRVFAFFGPDPAERDSGFTGSSDISTLLADDVDNDGDTDLVMGDRVNDRYSLLLWREPGDPQGEGWPAGVPGRVSNTLVQNTGSGAGDFDGDGKRDLAFVNYGSLAIHLGNGDGTFGAGQQFTLPGSGFDRYSRMAVGDVNGDAKPDIVISVASFFGGGAEDKVIVYRNTSGGAAPDTAPPDTTIDNAKSTGGTIATPTAVVYFGSTEEPSSYECRLEPVGTYEPCTSPKVYSGLANGSYTFSVRARDAAGNVDPSPAVRTFTIDVPPPPPPPPPPPTNPFGNAVGVDSGRQQSGTPTSGWAPPSNGTTTSSGGSVPLGTGTNPPTTGTTQTVTTGGGGSPRLGAAAKRKRKPKPIVVARGRTTIPAGTTRRLTAKLTAAGKKLLRKKRTLRVTVTVVARGIDGTTGTVKRTIKLKRGRRR